MRKYVIYCLVVVLLVGVVPVGVSAAENDGIYEVVIYPNKKGMQTLDSEENLVLGDIEVTYDVNYENNEIDIYFEEPIFASNIISEGNTLHKKIVVNGIDEVLVNEELKTEGFMFDDVENLFLEYDDIENVDSITIMSLGEDSFKNGLLEGTKLKRKNGHEDILELTDNKLSTCRIINYGEIFYYEFSSPVYVDYFRVAHSYYNTKSNSYFNVRFYDNNGFQVFVRSFYPDYSTIIDEIKVDKPNVKKIEIRSSDGKGARVHEIEVFKKIELKEVDGLDYSVNDKDVVLNWSNPVFDGFTGVNIYRNGVKIKDKYNGNNYIDTGLNYGDYVYKVTTCHTSGQESQGKTINVKLEEPPQEEVKNVNYTIDGYDIILDWENPVSDKFEGVNIYRNGVLIEENYIETTYTDEGLEPGIYDYKITTLYTGNESEGTIISVEVKEIIPEEVANLDYTVEGNNVTLTWTNPNNKNFEGVNIYRDGEHIETTTEESFTETLPIGTYQYRITTLEAGEESEGITIDVSVQTIPTPVKGVNMINTSSTGGSITWEPNPKAQNIIKYIVYVNGEKHGEIENPPYKLEDLEVGKKYDIAVSAVNDLGEGDRSDTVSYTPSKIEDLKSTIKVGEIFSYISLLFLKVWPLLALSLTFILFPHITNAIKSVVRSRSA